MFWKICIIHKKTFDKIKLIVVKGELANETVNYDTKSKAYVPIWAGSDSY